MPLTPPARTPADDEAVLVDAVVAAVLAVPDVARLDGGAFGTVATLLPGRRVLGVRVGAPGEAVEVAVVVRFGPPLPAVAAAVGAAVRGVLGDVAVDVTVADVDIPVVAVAERPVVAVAERPVVAAAGARVGTAPDTLRDGFA